MFDINSIVLSFINSRDVREFLMQNAYEFQPIESAWIIGRSVSKSIEEKHDAYRVLIAATKDFELPSILADNDTTRFHSFLERYISEENNNIKEFLNTEENCVYTYKQQSRNNVKYLGDDGCCGLFSSFENALANARDSWRDTEVDSFCFSKYRIDSDEAAVDVWTNYDGQIIDIVNYEKIESQLKYNLDQLYYEIPVPFKRGDILCYFNQHNGHSYGECSGPLVVEGVCDITPLKKAGYGDSSDMNVYGLFQNEETGQMYHEVSLDNYLDMEYYRGEYTGVRRALKTVSSFLKNEIPLDLFINAYARIIVEESARNINLSCYLEESVNKAGL